MQKNVKDKSSSLIIKSREELTNAVGEIGSKQREIKQIEKDLDEEIEKLKVLVQEKIAPLTAEVNRQAEGILAYAQIKWDELTGKGKTIKLTTGQISKRKGSPKVKVTGEEKEIVELLKKQGLDDFINVVESLNKTALKDCPQIISTIEGLKIVQDEFFEIKPASQEIGLDLTLKFKV